MAGGKSKPELAEQLDRLAEDLVLASPDDDASMAEVAGGLKEVSKQLKRKKKGKSITAIVKRVDDARKQWEKAVSLAQSFNQPGIEAQAKGLLSRLR